MLVAPGSPPRSAQKQMLGEYLFPMVRRMHPVWAGKITGMILELDNRELFRMLGHRELLKAKVDEAVGILERHYQAKLQANKKANLIRTMEPVAASSRSADVPKPQYPFGYVSAVSKCQTSDASNLCIHDALSKLKDDGDFDIGGTYADAEPEFWFFYTTSVCHGGNHLLNLFVCHRKTGTFAISVASSNELTQKVAPGDEVPHLLLPETMTTYNFKSTKPNRNFFIKTYCFKTLDRFNQSCTLYIPVKIAVNPKFVLNINVVKSIKLQHDLSELLRRQETTDFVLESRTHKKFPTHKILLAAHSPVLRNMLKNTELTSMMIDISDNDMLLLLQFIYTGTIKDVMKQDCLKLLEIADKFELTQLFTLTQHVIGDQISVNNAVEMAVIAKKYKLEELQKRVFAYIAKHPKVLETKAWNDLTDVELTKYLFRYTRSMKE